MAVAKPCTACTLQLVATAPTKSHATVLANVHNNPATLKPVPLPSHATNGPLWHSHIHVARGGGANHKFHSNSCTTKSATLPATLATMQLCQCVNIAMRTTAAKVPGRSCHTTLCVLRTK
jgi:hypothetical protein